MRKYVIFTLVVVCQIVLLTSVALAERPIRIVVFDPLSGPLKVFGERFEMGWKLAADEVNASGGILGRKVEIIMEDDQFKPEVALRKAQKHFMQGDVDFMSKSFGSHIVNSLMELAEQNNIVFISTAMSDDAAQKSFSYNTIQLVYRTAIMARLLITYIKDYKDFNKFYLINPDYAYGHDMAAKFEKEVARLLPKAKIVGNDFHPMNTKDLSSILTKVKATNADCILTGSFGLPLSILLKQRHQFGVTAVVVSNPLADPMNMRELAEVSQGSIVSDCWMSTVKTKESDAFRALWREKYKDTAWPEADDIGGRTYIAAKFLFNGIKKAGSVEVKKLIPAMEDMRQTTLNGEAYLRACTHTLQSDLPVGEVVSTSPPYYSVPSIIKADQIVIESEAIDNPRCK